MNYFYNRKKFEKKPQVAFTLNYMISKRFPKAIACYKNKVGNIQKTKASLKFVRVSAKKIRPILRQIFGKFWIHAGLLLTSYPSLRSNFITNVLLSAISNASDKYDLETLKLKSLIITKIFVTQGSTLKRFWARAKGLTYKILKPTAHINLTLSRLVKISSLVCIMMNKYDFFT